MDDGEMYIKEYEQKVGKPAGNATLHLRGE